MIETSASYESCRGRQLASAEEYRLPPGSALLVIFGLSLVAWGLVLVPLFVIFHE